ncbi:unnamed protein product [Litomosoides sigmodontis]|uniref:EGF-like domain-containing protein n=1 Tax=Litomosoides sigmodontis TaxID=42156 RepID=A0A3P6TNS6_LITSI|nr:unnamed protein product [Litomosoides sigmodontis]
MYVCNISDVDECQFENGGCEFRCRNTDGGYRCECPPRMQLHSNGRRCVRRNICATNNGGCEHVCEERHGRFHRCKCRQGFKLASDKRRCHPTDPCLINRGGCEQHCVNDNGRAVCQCYYGLRLGSDQKSCIDIDECATTKGLTCDHECINVYGTYRCRCRTGYQLLSDGHKCKPLINPCQIINVTVCRNLQNENGYCEHICENDNDGGVKCSCKPGYQLNNDGRSCSGKL